jgi:translation initiation factor IF-1
MPNRGKSDIRINEGNCVVVDPCNEDGERVEDA